ncbi:MAG: M23 family metallopeptidase [Mycoplasmatales bacterium]
MAAPIVTAIAKKVAVQLVQNKNVRHFLIGLIIFLFLIITSPLIIFTQNIETGQQEVKLQYPVEPPTIGEKYGYYTGTTTSHRGIDFPLAYGTEVKASASGKVVYAEMICDANGGYIGNMCGGGFGNYVAINSGSFLVVYAHLSKINVASGSVVDVGSKIGEIGHSGYSSGAHLHLALTLNPSTFEWVDPLPYFTKAIKVNTEEDKREILKTAGLSQNEIDMYYFQLDYLLSESGWNMTYESDGKFGICAIETDITKQTQTDQINSCIDYFNETFGSIDKAYEKTLEKNLKNLEASFGKT